MKYETKQKIKKTLEGEVYVIFFAGYFLDCSGLFEKNEEDRNKKYPEKMEQKGNKDSLDNLVIDDTPWMYNKAPADGTLYNNNYWRGREK